MLKTYMHHRGGEKENRSTKLARDKMIKIYIFYYFVYFLFPVNARVTGTKRGRSTWVDVRVDEKRRFSSSMSPE